MKVSKQTAIDLINCDTDDCEDVFELVDEGKWRDMGKFQHLTVVVKHKESGKLYSISCERSGSYYTDYYYSSEDWPAEVELTEVEPVEKTVITYKPVKKTEPNLTA